MDTYKVLEVLQGKTITWESQDYHSFRDAHHIKILKTKKNCNPDVKYVVKLIQPPGVAKSKVGILK
jgi:hypothetical protein